MEEGGESRKTPQGVLQENLRRFLTKHPEDSGKKGKASVAPLIKKGKTPLQDTRDQQTVETKPVETTRE